jgi:hypothetical protein
VISNWYGALKGAGLFRTFTPNNDTADIVDAVGEEDFMRYDSGRLF